MFDNGRDPYLLMTLFAQFISRQCVDIMIPVIQEAHSLEILKRNSKNFAAI